ncbi:MAG: galactokinase [Clostridia bacterium]|nr:galactokinase [Clostridia bacterium]
MLCSDLISYFENGGADKRFAALYGEKNVPSQRKRYASAAAGFMKLYGDGECVVLSVSGRSEISGNHTDHNKGCVLAASVDVDIIAVVMKTDDKIIRVKSEGFDEDLCDLAAVPDKNGMRYSSKAIIYGVCDGFSKRGYKTGGFRAFTTSTVLKGSGLSSSAAFEDMMGYILSVLYNGGSVSDVEIAKISQYAENEFFGKPCGLMDQVACAVGGFVYIDFGSDEPEIVPVPFDLTAAGYDLCIVNTGGNHADLNEDYASVPAEMKGAAALFGKKALRGLTEDDIINKLPKIREKLGDRAALRAVHFIRENERVKKQKDALLSGNIDGFLQCAKESGDSSYKYLQNVYTNKNPSEQGLSLALCMTEGFLKGQKAAYRVHGGGFAGTIQAYVPSSLTDEYKAFTERIFGPGSCSVLHVRAEGTARIV